MTPGTTGVHVVGYLRAESGVGEAARLLVACLRAAGIPYSLLLHEGTVARQDHPFSFEDASAETFDTNIVCVNADQLPVFVSRLAPEHFAGRRTIARWHWEVDRFPAHLAKSAELVDEIWVSSRHEERAIAPVVCRPVHRLPLPVLPPDAPQWTRRELGLPEGFLVLFCYDVLSVSQRKNPEGVVRAFQKAFPLPGVATLLVKAVNSRYDPGGFRRLMGEVAGRADILVWDGYLSTAHHGALMSSCDAYVSLHRSEGFGLTMAEAMAMGKPVIATGYSGNLDFMNEQNSFLVPYELVPIPEDCGPYPSEGQWAEPDEAAAADLLRLVFEDRPEAIERGLRAQQDVLQDHSPRARVGLIRGLLDSPAEPSRASVSPLVASGPDRGAMAALAAAALPPLRRVKRGVVGVGRRAVGWRDVADLQGHLRRIEADGQSQVQRLEAVLRDLERQVAETASQLYAPPYSTEPLRTIDPQGRVTIGYRSRSDGPADDRYRAFEEVFRGSEGFVRERQRFYVALLGAHGPVVDLGCGRGELLDLLKEASIDAVGVDSDAGMVRRSREKGHEVVEADAVEYLREAAPATLGAIVSMQFVEHLPYPGILELLEVSCRALRAGGVFVAETVNPHALGAWKTFWTDISHQVPIFPEALCVLCAEAGFEETYVVFPQGVGDLEADRRRCGEYSVVATKGPAAA